MDTMPGNDPMDNQAPLSGLDPADLLRQGAAADTLLDGASTAFHPPTIEEIAAAFPQFEILELIGQGGMGAVYKVRQKDLDRVVALKILPPAIGQSPESSHRFTREARALAKLNHPGIVTIHEFGQRNGLFFILMEFVDGVNLAQLMKTGRVSPREALAIVPQVCDALQYAHDQGIVHRDIKPENLLLDRQGRVKVADFGIAKVVAAVRDPMAGGNAPAPENQTLAGNIIGTPQYMAPEQIEHPSEVDHRADIYALGVVFYQMLTGELPGNDLRAPSRKFHIDVRLDEIVLKALEKTPGLRYQTAGIFKTQLENIASEMGSTARGAGALPDSRFSRTAIVGACWAPLILFAYIMWFSVSVSVKSSPGEEPPGPAWWQYLMMFTLLPLGLTAPFGTTILGWVSVSRIRRSAGKLHGMWLAVLDGLLFPLLFLTGLIGWFWH
jgi:serine/threonine protein kinase